jgi:hypothetical protein
MRADQVAASRDPARKKWLLRIRIGEEVIRRYTSAPFDAEDEALERIAGQTLRDEGYEPDPEELTIRR